jgi:beta-lactamase regulating signal transducer with metallopeptidase domain
MDFSFMPLIIKAGRFMMPILWQNTLYAGIIFIIIWLVNTTLKIRSPQWQLALWLIVLIRLILPPDFSLPCSGRNLIARLPVVERFVQIFDFLNPNQRSVMIEQNDSLGVSGDDQLIPVENISRSWLFNKYQTDRFFAGSFFIWIMGTFIFLTIYLKKLIRFHVIVKKANIVENQNTQAILQEWCAQLKIKLKVRLVSSGQYLSPFTVGIIKPIIYLPQRTIDLENINHLESIIAHEICHIKRVDNLWIKLQSLLQIVYFFNPVVWYINSKISLSRECICDNMVLSSKKISAEIYGNGIMTVLKLNLFGAEGINVLPGFGSQRKKLMYRLNNLKGTKMKAKYQSLLIVGTLFFLGILFLPMTQNALDDQTDRSITATQVIAGENDINSKNLKSIQKEDIDFAVPIKKGSVSAPYGNMNDPYTQKIVHHNGIDIAAPIGTEIYAAAAGTVKIAASEKGPGKHILLQHDNGYQTFYSHCDSLLSQKGQQIKSGEVIAYVGQTGKATGPHLHFEIRKDGQPQDPQKLINFEELKVVK